MRFLPRRRPDRQLRRNAISSLPLPLQHPHGSGIRRLGPADLPELLRALGVDPVPNVFLLNFARVTGLRPLPNSAAFYGRFDEAGRIVAVLSVGPALMPWAADPTQIRSLAAAALQTPRRWTTLLGEESVVDSLWEAIAPHVVPPVQDALELWLAATRDEFMPVQLGGLGRRQAPSDYSDGSVRWVDELDQPDRVVRRSAALVPSECVVRRAIPSDLPALLDLRCSLYEEPEGCRLPPRERDRIDRRCRDSLRQNALFVVEQKNDLIFTACFSAETPEVTQISSVVTRLDRRGQGVGTAAVSALCRLALAGSERVSLFVEEANLPAMRVYVKLGLRRVASARSLRLEKWP